MSSTKNEIELEYDWEDCSIGFHCPVCGELLVADSRDEMQICECGKYRYQLSARIISEFTVDDK